MKRILIAVLVCLNFGANAAPFVTSDPTTQTVTHCGALIDSAAKVDSVVDIVTPTSFRCKIDIGTVSVGTHTIKATFVNIDPVWGRSESVNSLPLDFVRPGNTVTSPPSGLGIVKIGIR